jgi:hypothetical protein
MFVVTMMADDEAGFIPLLNDDQLSRWSGDRAVWTVQQNEIRGRWAAPSKPSVYEGRPFGSHVLRFAAHTQTGAVRILLRNLRSHGLLRLVPRKCGCE